MGHLSCFQSFVTINSAAINMTVQITLSYPGGHSLTYMPGVISQDCMVVIFYSLRGLHIAFHSDLANLYPHQQYRSVLCFPHPCQHLLLFVLLIIAIWLGEVESQCPFDLHSFMAKLLKISSYAYWPFVLLLRIIC
jgi:hypothetical protein